MLACGSDVAQLFAPRRGENAAAVTSAPPGEGRAVAGDDQVPNERLAVTERWLGAFLQHLEDVERLQQEGAAEDSIASAAGFRPREVEDSHKQLAQVLRTHRDLQFQLLSVLPPDAAERVRAAVRAAGSEADADSSQSSSGRRSISRGFSLSGSNPGASSGRDEGATGSLADSTTSNNGSHDSGTSNNGSLLAGDNGDSNNDGSSNTGRSSNNGGSSNNGLLGVDDMEASDGSETPLGSASEGPVPPTASRGRGSQPRSAAGTAPPAWQTTLTVHGVSRSYTQDDLIEEWELEGSYDFLHFRQSNARRTERIVVVNFLSAAEAARFRSRWHEGVLSRQSPLRRLTITDGPVQGKDVNLMLIRDDTAVLPVVVLGGERLGPDRVLSLIRLAKKGLFLCSF